MADNSLLPRSYMAPPYSGNFGYPNLETALAETDDQARVAMYGPREGMLANLHAEADRGAIQEGRDAVAREEAQPGQVANFLAYQTPVVGNALAARDAVESAGNRDWLGFGLNALGALPLLGTIGGPLARKVLTPWVGYRAVHEAAADSWAMEQAARNAAKPFDYSLHFRTMNGANAAARADTAAIQAETEMRRAHEIAMQKVLGDLEARRAVVNAPYRKPFEEGR
jgi:hypothetical protein